MVYDMLGRGIEVLLDNNPEPGKYEVEWNGADHASGVYFYRLVTDCFTDVMKMVLIK